MNNFDNIDWKQNPNGISMFEVNWFVYTIGLAETSNEILDKVSKRKDYIAIITKYLPKHINMFRSFCQKSSPTKEMKEYLKQTLIRGINDCINVFEDYNFSKSEIDLLKRNINQIEKIEI